MAETPSTMAPLGMKAPDFALPDTAGNTVSLSDFEGGAGLLVAFICNHCPYVKHIAGELADFGGEYQDLGLGVVAIASNDADNYPQDGPEAMVTEAEERGYAFPYLFDGTQEVAKAYTAACTPDLFLFDEDLELVYRGQFDSSRPGNGLPVTGEHLRAATDAMLAGGPVSEEQLPSVGCNIKWKAGNEPDYF